MFKPARMKKIEIISLDRYREDILKRLHELGAVEITDLKEKIDDPMWESLLEPHDADVNIKDTATKLSSIDSILESFEEVSPKYKDNFIKSLFKPTPPRKIPVEDVFGGELLQKAGNLISAVGEEIKDPIDAIDRIDKELLDLIDLKSSLERISALDIEIELLKPTKNLVSFVGICKMEDYAKISGNLDETGVKYLAEKVDISKEESILVATSLREESGAVANILRKSSFERAEIDFEKYDLHGNILNVISEVEEKIGRLGEERDELKKKVAESAEKWRDELESYQELLEIERERETIKTSLAKTENTFLIEGWVPAKDEKSVLDDIKKFGCSMVETTDPDDPKDVPVKLENPSFFKHFEGLTNLYSTPKYGEIDPTILLAISFAIFFGIMLTDAVYGLMTLALGIALWKGGGRYNESIKDFGVILAVAGIPTIVMGILTGGYFCDLPIKYLHIEWLKNLMVIDPLHQAMAFLIISLAIGVIHLNMAFLCDLINRAKKGIKEVTKGEVWLFPFEFGIVLIASLSHFYHYALFQPVPGMILGWGLLVISLVLLFISKGGLFLFGITGLLGDILSYARLMALGIVTSGIGNVVNLLAVLPLGMGALGWIFAAIIFLLGHALNFVINFLGAAVHGIRLEYAEFFSKFYAGGGAEFTPFEMKREVTENIKKI